MLKKLIKHDFKELFSWCRFIWLSALLTSVLLIVTIRIGSIFDSVIFVLVMLLAILALVLCDFASQICVYIRYYKNFATDEAYLTFTLPVSRRSLLLSKTIAALIEAFVRYLFYLLLLIACIIFIPPYDDPTAFINTQTLMGIRDALYDGWVALGPWLIAYIPVFILFLAVCTVLSSSVVYIAITLGTLISQKSRILVTIGVLYIFYVLSSYIIPIFVFIPAITTIVPLIERIVALPQGAIGAALFVAGLLLTVVIAAIGSIVYFINLGLLERKLNLP